MKNKLSFLIIIVTLYLTACSLPNVQTTWSKPGAQPGEFERDQAECEQDLGITGLRGDAGFEFCMERKGWFRHAD